MCIFMSVVLISRTLANFEDMDVISQEFSYKALNNLFEGKENLAHIMVYYLIIHIFSYICEVYRAFELKKNGKPDVYGVYRAPNEYTLNIIENFIGCVMFGYAVKHVLQMD